MGKTFSLKRIWCSIKEYKSGFVFFHCVGLYLFWPFSTFLWKFFILSFTYKCDESGVTRLLQHLTLLFLTTMPLENKFSGHPRSLHLGSRLLESSRYVILLKKARPFWVSSIYLANLLWVRGSPWWTRLSAQNVAVNAVYYTTRGRRITCPMREATLHERHCSAIQNKNIARDTLLTLFFLQHLTIFFFVCEAFGLHTEILVQIHDMPGPFF